MRRVQKMPYPPPIPLPVPTAVPARPPGVAGTDLDNLGLMSDEEADSNEQLYHSVGLCSASHPGCLPAHAYIGFSSSCVMTSASR